MKVEFELNEHRVFVAAACGLVGVFALHGAFPGLYDFWPKSSSELADWVQAIGSIAAIIGAIWITRYQLKMAKRAAQYSELSRHAQMTKVAMEASIGVYRATVSVNWVINHVFEGRSNWVSFQRNRLRHAHETLGVIIAKDMDGELFGNILELRAAVGQALRGLELFESPDDIDQENAIKDGRVARRKAAFARYKIRKARRTARKDLLD